MIETLKDLPNNNTEHYSKCISNRLLYTAEMAAVYTMNVLFVISKKTEQDIKDLAVPKFDLEFGMVDFQRTWKKLRCIEPLKKSLIFDFYFFYASLLPVLLGFFDKKNGIKREMLINIFESSLTGNEVILKEFGNRNSDSSTIDKSVSTFYELVHKFTSPFSTSPSRVLRLVKNCYPTDIIFEKNISHDSLFHGDGSFSAFPTGGQISLRLNKWNSKLIDDFSEMDKWLFILFLEHHFDENFVFNVFRSFRINLLMTLIMSSVNPV